jgi:hypothetical protein
MAGIFDSISLARGLISWRWSRSWSLRRAYKLLVQVFHALGTGKFAWRQDRASQREGIFVMYWIDASHTIIPGGKNIFTIRAEAKMKDIFIMP